MLKTCVISLVTEHKLKEILIESVCRSTFYRFCRISLRSPQGSSNRYINFILSKTGTYFKMEKQTNDSILGDTYHTGYLIVPKEEIIEDLEITYDGAKNSMITPKEVSNSSLSDMADSDPHIVKLKQIKTETIPSKGIASIQQSGEVASKGLDASIRHNIKDSLPKTSRKRNANFTPEEKDLLTQLIKKRPIIQSKLTDGKSVMMKKMAWDLITKEFNSHAHVHQRNTNTLKRGWDNMKAVTRRVVTVPGNSSKTGSESGQTVIEEVAPVCEVETSLDSDGTFHNFISQRSLSVSNDELENLGYLTDEKDSQDKSRVEFDSASQNGPFIHQPSTCPGTTLDSISTSPPSDLTRREALVRIQHMKEKQKIEIEILKAQLETAESQKRAALIEEDRSRLRLEVARAELEKLKKIDIKMLYNNISNSNKK